MENLVMNISKDALIKNPKGGMTIAFRYADDDGNLDDFIHLGYICEWDTVHDRDMGTIATLLYMDVAILYETGALVELHCEFDPDRMSDIRLATEDEVRQLSQSLIPARTQLMIEGIMSNRDEVNLEDNDILITTSGCEGEYRDRVVKIYKYLDILRLETNEGGRELLDSVSSEEMYEICTALRSKC